SSLGCAGRRVRGQLEPPLLEALQSRLVLAYDELAVGLASHLEPERRVAQVGVAYVLTLLVHDATSIATAKDEPALGDLREQGIAIALFGQLVQPGIFPAHLSHRGGCLLEQHVPVPRGRR